ncbi:toluene hydroxylase [Ferviditalea candida]|uniref:propane 2-monooxygenase n=1 Tax=Ferviditalea candida TaxID=3108399 RepID=A0ABU5ZCM3_9BACL|nr:toluene hydroxylase [Paenibacillaceae bacterium T2]
MSGPQREMLEPIRKQPWDWKTKNEYEEVTVRQQPYLHGHYRHIFDERDYDIFDPRYTRLKSSDWEAFRDPKKYWYTTYTSDRKKMAEQVENNFSQAEEFHVIEHLDPSWVEAARTIYTPLRHLEYGESVQLQHVIRYALGTSIEQCSTFQSFDKTGRAQWITQWAMNMEAHHGDFLGFGKEIFMSQPAFQALRSYVEEVLVTDDWGEVLVALNLTLDPLLGNLIYRDFNRLALKHGDTHLAGLNYAIIKQMDWHADWAFALFGLLAEERATSRWDYLKSLGYEDWPGDYRWGMTLSDPRNTPEEPMHNREIINEWVGKWYPKAYHAVSQLSSLFERHNLQLNVQEALQAIQKERIEPKYKNAGIAFQGV